MWSGGGTSLSANLGLVCQEATARAMSSHSAKAIISESLWRGIDEERSCLRAARSCHSCCDCEMCLHIVYEMVDLLTDVEGHQKGVKLSCAQCMMLSQSCF